MLVPSQVLLELLPELLELLEMLQLSAAGVAA